jgi:membrane protein
MENQVKQVWTQAAGAAAARAKHAASDAMHDPTLRARLWDTAKYLTQTEVHTYAFSVAANAILSFFPFLLLMLTIIDRKLHSRTMSDVFVSLLRDYLPTNQDFVIGNLRKMVWARGGGIKVFSLIMLLFTSSGVFLPLEVALNKVWGIPKDRSYLGNQVVSLLLAFGCGALAMLSVAASAGNHLLLHNLLGDHADNFLIKGVEWLVMKLCAVLASILIFFVIFWLLPNGRVPVKPVLSAAFLTGVLWEGGKYLYMLSLPLLNFQEAYGPFSISVTLIFWAFLSGLLLLGGAYLSATKGASQRSA